MKKNEATCEIKPPSEFFVNIFAPWCEKGIQPEVGKWYTFWGETGMQHNYLIYYPGDWTRVDISRIDYGQYPVGIADFTPMLVVENSPQRGFWVKLLGDEKVYKTNVNTYCFYWEDKKP